MSQSVPPEFLAKTQGPGTVDVVGAGIYKKVGTANALLVSDPSDYQNTKVASLAKDIYVQVKDTGAGKTWNNVTDNKYKWWEVEAASGADAGKTGWVLAANLVTAYTVQEEGDTDSAAKVGDGEVKARTGNDVQIASSRNEDGFGITYEGKDADKAQWLQFIWREVIGVDSAEANPSPLAENITTSGGSYKLTSGGTWTANGGPSSENYNTDTASTSDPFYESKGMADRSADAATIYDQPSAAQTKVDKAFNAGAKKVVSRAHFHTFLIKSDKVAHQVNTDVEWK